MSALTGSTARPLAEEDFEAAHALLVLDEEHAMGRPSRIEVSDLRAWFGSVDFDQDTWLLEADGRLVGFGWHERHGEVAFAVGVVHPDARGRGLGGMTRVSLGVDAESPTGATKLYESVGMTTEAEHVVFEKALA